MRTAVAFLALAAFAAVAQGQCTGDLVVDQSFSGYFNGKYFMEKDASGNPILYNGKPVWTATTLLVGPKSIFRSVHPAGLWVVQDSTGHDGAAFYDYAISGAADPSAITAGTWGNGNSASYLYSAVIKCTQTVPPAPPVAPPADPPPAPAVYTQCFEAGFSASASSVFAGCYNYCGCTAGATCSHCCFHNTTDNTCRRGSELPAQFQTATAGYERTCDASKCQAHKKGDGVCHGECNNPDCGYDSDANGVSDCCATPSSYQHHATHPLHCQKDTMTMNQTFYWRLEYHIPKCRKHVRNQGSCGACYAFAVTTAANHQQCMAGDPTHHKQLSPQFLDSCYTTAQGGSNSGVSCSGGVIEYNNRELTASTAAAGYPYEECYPYVSVAKTSANPTLCTSAGPAPACSGSANTFVTYKPGNSLTESKNFYAIDLNIANKELIKKLLRYLGPISFKFTTTEGFMNQYNASAGFVPDSTVSSGYKGLYRGDYGSALQHGGHAVVCTGYTWFYAADGVTKKYAYVFENSWGYAATHDLGYFYWDMDDHSASTVGAQFVIAGDQRKAIEVSGVQDFCTKDGSCCSTPACNAAATGRRLQEAPPRRLQQFNRRLLQDNVNSLDASGQVTPLKGNGGIEVTECERPAALEVIEESLDAITDAISDAAGINVTVSMKDTKRCLAQASGHQHFFFDLSVNIEYVFHRDVQINITKAPKEECRTVDADGDCTEGEVLEDGFRLDHYEVSGAVLDDEGNPEIVFGGSKERHKHAVFRHYNNRTVEVFHPKYKEGKVNFWEFVAAVCTGGAFVFVFVIMLRMGARMIRRRGGGDDEDDGTMYEYQNPVASGSEAPHAPMNPGGKQ